MTVVCQTGKNTTQPDIKLVSSDSMDTFICSNGWVKIKQPYRRQTLRSDSEGPIQFVILPWSLFNVNFSSPEPTPRKKLFETTFVVVVVSHQNVYTMPISSPLAHFAFMSFLLMQQYKTAAGSGQCLLRISHEMSGDERSAAAVCHWVEELSITFFFYFSTCKCSFFQEVDIFLWCGQEISFFFALSLYVWPSSEMLGCLCDLISESMLNKWQMLPRILLIVGHFTCMQINVDISADHRGFILLCITLLLFHLKY